MATSDVCVPLPMEVWRQVALHMSTRDLAKGLAQVCKAFRHLGTSAICLSSSNSKSRFCTDLFFIASEIVFDAIIHAVRHARLCYAEAALEWTQKRWAGVSKLLLKPKNDPECTVLMSWACRHCQELGPLEQLGIVVNTSSTKETHSASCVAATVNILAHQVQLSACKVMVQSDQGLHIGVLATSRPVPSGPYTEINKTYLRPQNKSIAQSYTVQGAGWSLATPRQECHIVRGCEAFLQCTCLRVFAKDLLRVNS